MQQCCCSWALCSTWRSRPCKKLPSQALPCKVNPGSSPLHLHREHTCRLCCQGARACSCAVCRVQASGAAPSDPDMQVTPGLLDDAQISRSQRACRRCSAGSCAGAGAAGASAPDLPCAAWGGQRPSPAGPRSTAGQVCLCCKREQAVHTDLINEPGGSIMRGSLAGCCWLQAWQLAMHGTYARALKQAMCRMHSLAAAHRLSAPAGAGAFATVTFAVGGAWRCLEHS